MFVILEHLFNAIVSFAIYSAISGLTNGYKLMINKLNI